MSIPLRIHLDFFMNPLLLNWTWLSLCYFIIHFIGGNSATEYNYLLKNRSGMKNFARYIDCVFTPFSLVFIWIYNLVIFNHFDLNYYDINSVFWLRAPSCLLGHVRNFLEKHRSAHTLTVCTVTFYVHAVTLVCNDADIFKLICLNMHFSCKPSLQFSFPFDCFEVIWYKTPKFWQINMYIISVFPLSINSLRRTKFTIVFLWCYFIIWSIFSYKHE